MNNPVPPFVPGSFENPVAPFIPEFMQALTAGSPELPEQEVPEELRRMGFRILAPGTFVDLHTWNRIVDGNQNPINPNPLKLQDQLPVMNHIVTLENGRQLVEPTTLGLAILSIGVDSHQGLSLDKRVETMSLLEQLAVAFPEIAQNLRNLDPAKFDTRNLLMDVRPAINPGLLK